MAKLTTRQRNSLRPSDFAIPEERKYPIQDRAHAIKALEFCKGTEYEARVKAAVAKRYPDLKQSGADETEPQGAPEETDAPGGGDMPAAMPAGMPAGMPMAMLGKGKPR